MRKLLLPLLLLPVLAAYSPVFKAGYTNWDDPDYTYANPLLKAPLKAFISAPLGHYHPLTHLSLGLEAAVFGESAVAHHAGNLLLHLANTALAFLLLKLLTGSAPAAFAGALLWALHPAQAESAAWLAERKNLLYSFFYLAGLLAYLRLPEGRRRLAAVAGLFLLSLLSKAPAVTLPLALLALDWRAGRLLDRGDLIEKGWLLLLAAAFALLAAAAQGRQGALLPAPVPGLFSFYLLKALWPLDLSALYPYAETLAAVKASFAATWLPAAAFALALALAVRRGARTAAFGLLFFLVNILPFALLVPTGPALAADRYLYLPLLGLALAIAAALAALPRYRRAAFAAAAMLALALGWQAFGRAAAWRSSETLWRSVLESYPASSVANQNLAQALLERGDAAEALPLLLAAVKADPANPGALYNLGTLLARSGAYAEALPLLERAALLKPGHAQAWANLGQTLLALGRREEARRAFLAALEADPSNGPAAAGLTRAGAGELAR